MTSDYYDIDAILAEEEATPVQFRIDACKLGYLDPGSVDDDVSTWLSFLSFRVR